MSNLTIRNLDETVANTLKMRAKSHDRSLEAEIRSILTDAARKPTRSDLRATLDRIAAMTPDVSQSDSTQLLREDRGR